MGSVVGRIVSPSKMLKSYTPVPMDVTLFGNKVFGDEVIRTGANPI